MEVTTNSKNNEKLSSKVRELFSSTDFTLEEIARQTGSTPKVVYGIVNRDFTKVERTERKKRNYARSKFGTLNPMSGKYGPKHHNYKGECPDGNGYVLVLKPTWYTGRVTQKHIFQHHLVMCEHLGLTEIPKGMVVHHVDGDKTNNDIDNLALMTMRAHSRLHGILNNLLAKIRRCNDYLFGE